MMLLALFFCQFTNVNALSIEGRVGYFYPQDKHIREIYGEKGFAEYELEVATFIDPFINTCLKRCNLAENCDANWALWGNWSFYKQKGHSTCLHNKTHIDNSAANFGLKYYFDVSDCTFGSGFFDFNCLRPYLGLGFGFVYTRFSDHGPGVESHNKYGFALLAKSGLEWQLNCGFFIDFFFDYAYNHTSKNHHHCCLSTNSVNTGGLKTGIGFGYRF